MFNAFSLSLGVTIATCMRIAGSEGGEYSNDERGLILKLSTALNAHKFTINQLHNFYVLTLAQNVYNIKYRARIV